MYYITMFPRNGSGTYIMKGMEYLYAYYRKSLHHLDNYDSTLSRCTSYCAYGWLNLEP